VPPSSVPEPPREGTEGALQEIFVLSSSGLLLRYYPQTGETRKHADALTSILKAVEIFTLRIFDSNLGELMSMAFAREAVGLVAGRYLRVAYMVGGRNLAAWAAPIARAIEGLEARYGAGLGAPVGLYPEVIKRFDEVFQPLLSPQGGPLARTPAAA
jgi:hypothetical protein